MNAKGAARETGWAKEAFNLYLQLPKPRDIAQLVGAEITSGRGAASRPLRLATLRAWAYVHSWEDKADRFDSEVAERERQELLDWKLQEARERRRERLVAARVQRSMALGFLIAPDDDDVPEEQRGMPRPMAECDPQYLQLADRYLKSAAESERADLGDVEKQGDQNEQTIGPIVVLQDHSKLEELRHLVERIQHAQPKAITADVVDADFERV